MKILFIGGTGIISSACSELALSKGYELFLLNRGKSMELRHIEGVKNIHSDYRNFEETKTALEGHQFDVVVDWIAFKPEHMHHSIKLFSGKAKQFIFISSASAYQTPPEHFPITEETPLSNPFWQYSRDKMECENILKEAHKTNGFPYTIVRPSHTYDKTSVPLLGRYMALHRMKQGLPVLVHGDGTSLWTLTHHKDFAVGLVGLFGNPAALNEAFHITSDEWLPWNAIYKAFADTLNVKPKLVHVPSRVIAQYDEEIGAGLLGDKSHSMIFDNSKIKAAVPEFGAKIPFSEGVKEIVDWHEKNPKLLKYDSEMDMLLARIINDFT